MSTRRARLRITVSISLALSLSAFALFGCVGEITAGGIGGGGDAPDATPGGGDPADGAPLLPPATATLSKVAITTLEGSSANAGAIGVFDASDLPIGIAAPPAISNTVLSAVPGAPPKALFVGQAAPFDSVLVAVEGRSGFYEVPAGANTVVGVDLVAAPEAVFGEVNVLVATRSGLLISAPARVKLLIDPHVFVAAGDLENHDTEGTNIADLFGTFLEGKQGSPAVPEQVIDDTDNNAEIVNGVKGLRGPIATGHREVVWDGVPEVLRNKADFSASFFDRQDDGAAGVRGGVIFEATNGTGQEVNDALGGAVPDPAVVGPPANLNADLGGDFSNVNAAFAGNLLSFTQSAQFAPLGTVITDVTFHVAGTTTPAVVQGMGVVFASVDREQVSSIEFFDENDTSIARVVVPVQSRGPFPLPGPLVATKFPYSFAGYVNHDARIARVRIVSGEVPIDTAIADLPDGTEDVVTFDDVYYSEPLP